jgi:hypothetical protein
MELRSVWAGTGRRRLVGAAIDVEATTAGKLRCAIKEVRFRWRAASEPAICTA